jgi:hypothetical protein
MVPMSHLWMVPKPSLIQIWSRAMNLKHFKKDVRVGRTWQDGITNCEKVL